MPKRILAVLAVQLCLIGFAFGYEMFDSTGNGHGDYLCFFTSNGNSSSLMCDRQSDRINRGENWSADANTLLEGHAKLYKGASNAWEDYQAAGLAASLGLAGSGRNSNDTDAANYAVWVLFEPSSRTSVGAKRLSEVHPPGDSFAIFNSFFDEYGKLSNLGTVSDINSNTFYFERSNAIAYAPAGKGHGEPQPFSVYSTPVPETTPLILTGTGLLAVAGVLRKKIAGLRSTRSDE